MTESAEPQATETVTAQEVEPTANLQAIRALLGSIRSEIEMNGDDDYDEMVLGILDRIASAETEEELFAAQELPPMTAGKDFTNIPFRLSEKDIKWMPSRIKEQWVYAILTVARMDNGQTETLDCGGKTFVTVLRKLQLLGGFEKYEQDGGRPFMLQAKGPEGGQVLFLRPISLDTPASEKRGAKGAKTRV